MLASNKLQAHAYEGVQQDKYLTILLKFHYNKLQMKEQQQRQRKLLEELRD